MGGVTPILHGTLDVAIESRQPSAPHGKPDFSDLERGKRNVWLWRWTRKLTHYGVRNLIEMQLPKESLRILLPINDS
jgi:hypothetical protein